MRRAEARRSASVMISSSIRWSLAGNDVDWMMKTSEPRTFSWISTKISMSAKRRTTALVSGRFSHLAISCASTGLELPATSLIEPFLADIDASPRALLDTTFSISRNPRNRRVSTSEEISGGGLAGNPSPPFSGQKWPIPGLSGMLTGRCSSATRRQMLPPRVRPARRSQPRDRGGRGAGAGGASGVPLIMPLRPLRPAWAIFRKTRSSAAAQASRPALPAGSSPDSRSARCWLLS